MGGGPKGGGGGGGGGSATGYCEDTTRVYFLFTSEPCTQ